MAVVVTARLDGAAFLVDAEVSVAVQGGHGVVSGLRGVAGELHHHDSDGRGFGERDIHANAGRMMMWTRMTRRCR